LVELQLKNIVEDKKAQVTAELFRGENGIPSFTIAAFPCGGEAKQLLTREQILTVEDHWETLQAAKELQRAGSGEGRHAVRGLGLLRLLWKGAQEWFVLASQAWRENEFLLIQQRLLELAEIHVFRRKDPNLEITYRTEMGESLMGAAEAQGLDFEGPAGSSGSHTPAARQLIDHVEIDELNGALIECMPTGGAFELFDLD
jgi:hypothetical protein